LRSGEEKGEVLTHTVLRPSGIEEEFSSQSRDIAIRVEGEAALFAGIVSVCDVSVNRAATFPT
jgi:hypothetical protein